MREFDKMAIDAKLDEEILEELIKQCEFFIIRTASETSKRYISNGDDEYSIALMAFVQAVEGYDYDKGSFFPFAELLMKRRLVDYFRTQSKYSTEINVSPYVFTSDIEDDDVAMQNAVNSKIVYEDNSSKGDIKEEIDAISSILKSYGFTFMDLTNCSPKAGKTKVQCAEACNYMLNNYMLIEKLRESKQLPIKTIVENCMISRKTLERHRKYIITAVEILSGDFPYLGEYLRYIREVQCNESGSN